MRPNLLHEATSAYGEHSLSAIAVMVTHPAPAREPWYVVFDKKRALPLYETDLAEEAIDRADRLTAISDLGQAAAALLKSDKNLYLVSPFDVSQSPDGLQLITDAMARGSASLVFGQDSGFTDVLEDNPYWEALRSAINAAPELSSRPKSVIFSTAEQLLLRDEEGIRTDTTDVYVLMQIEWQGTAPVSARLTVLDEDYPVNGKALYEHLYEMSHSPECEIWYESPEELATWEMATLKAMPLFSQLRKPEHTHRVLAYEGGPMMKSLVKTHPWLLEKDGDGKAVPLRVKIVPDDEEFGEDALRKDHHLLASAYLTGVLEQDGRDKDGTRWDRRYEASHPPATLHDDHLVSHKETERKDDSGPSLG
ncbi:hypothetical protein SAMN04489711_1363 [Paracidovorax wautersii]|uniref:Uncharacterized protein n=2 Tax=Paracidovorax wautersii TaxID=1177982 RepID=A0A1I2HWA0_9BURK|nr:hypothetical protein SAMN04489711_1363 [Paracidovorax wautersii]